MLIGDGQQGVLMPRVELVDDAGQRLGTGAERQITQTAFFELGEFAADLLGGAGDDAGHTKLASQRNANLCARESLVGDQRSKRLSELFHATVRVERSGFLSPADRA